MSLMNDVYKIIDGRPTQFFEHTKQLAKQSIVALTVLALVTIPASIILHAQSAAALTYMFSAGLKGFVLPAVWVSSHVISALFLMVLFTVALTYWFLDEPNEILVNGLIGGLAIYGVLATFVLHFGVSICANAVLHTLQILSSPSLLMLGHYAAIGVVAMSVVFLAAHLLHRKNIQQKTMLTMSRGLMTFASLSVAAFTAGGFVKPVISYLSFFHIPYATGLALVVFMLSIPLWNFIYNGDNDGMSANFALGFLNPSERKVYQAYNKLKKAYTLDNTSEENSTSNEEPCKQYMRAGLTVWFLKKLAVDFQDQLDTRHDILTLKQPIDSRLDELMLAINMFGDIVRLDDQNRLLFAINYNDTESQDPSELNELVAQLVDKSNTEYKNSATWLYLSKMQTKVSRETQNYHWFGIKSDWAKMSTSPFKRVSSIARLWGDLNAWIANSTGNMIGAVGIATGFHVLHITQLPIVLQATFILWAGAVGYWAAAAITRASIIRRMKNVLKSIMAKQVSAKQAPLSFGRKLLVALTALSGFMTGICLAVFNFNSALNIGHDAFYMLFHSAPAILSPHGMLSVGLAWSAGILTIVASVSFFVAFSLPIVSAQPEKNIFKMIGEFLFQGFIAPILRLWSNSAPQTSDTANQWIYFPLVCACTAATTTLLHSGIIASTGPFVASLGLAHAHLLANIMLFPAAYLVFFMYKYGADNIHQYLQEENTPAIDTSYFSKSQCRMAFSLSDDRVMPKGPIMDHTNRFNLADVFKSTFEIQ